MKQIPGACLRSRKSRKGNWNMEMEFRHASVLLNETIDALKVKPQGVYLDGTLGGGGHACEVC